MPQKFTAEAVEALNAVCSAHHDTIRRALHSQYELGRSEANKTDPAPEAGWSEWLDWAGDEESPLPDAAMVEIDKGGRRLAGAVAWLHVRRFCYREDAPGGWVARPKGWVPPESLWAERSPVRCEWINAPVDSSAIQREQMSPKTWCFATHIRLLPRAPASEPAPEMPDLDETSRYLLVASMKRDEIAGEKQGERVDELIRWMVRFGEGHANPKWLAAHAAELAFYAHQQRLKEMEQR